MSGGANCHSSLESDWIKHTINPKQGEAKYYCSFITEWLKHIINQKQGEAFCMLVLIKTLEQNTISTCEAPP